MDPILFIVFLPLLAALIAGLGNRMIGNVPAKLVTTAALFASCGLSWPIFLAFMGGTAEAHVVPVLHWVQSGSLTFDWALRVDTLTAVMLVVITTVSALVHLYSWGYMDEDPDQPRFFAYLSLFTFAMLMLVTADNLVQMFFGWEGVGLASYLLIGFWNHNPAYATAANKAITTRANVRSLSAKTPEYLIADAGKRVIVLEKNAVVGGAAVDDVLLVLLERLLIHLQPELLLLDYGLPGIDGLQAYEQIVLAEEIIGDSMKYLLPNTTITVDFYDGNPVGIELPNVVVLGLAWWALDFPFMKRGRGHGARQNDLKTTREACEKFKRIPTSVINFVEGTRFTPAKHARQQSPYRHLLKPKIGGLGIALATMGEQFEALLDVTIVYPHGTPTFWHLLCGELPGVVVRVQQRDVVKQTIYEITGISDILRGATNPHETASAQNIKASWGSQRIQRFQGDVGRYCRDLFRMFAEIIVSKFDWEYLKQITSMDFAPEPVNPEEVQPPPEMMGHNGGPPMDDGGMQPEMDPAQMQQMQMQAVQEAQAQKQQEAEEKAAEIATDAAAWNAMFATVGPVATAETPAPEQAAPEPTADPEPDPETEDES